MTEADYEAALLEIDALWDSPPGSAEDLRLEALIVAVCAYEAIFYPIETGDIELD